MKSKTETEDDNREKLLNDRLEPKCTKSTTDNENREPNLIIPKTDT